jgi:hypothetical protein
LRRRKSFLREKLGVGVWDDVEERLPRTVEVEGRDSWWGTRDEFSILIATYTKSKQKIDKFTDKD